MRIPILLLTVLFTAAALAQSPARPRPPGTTPLEEPPPMPAAPAGIDPAIEAQSQVTTREEGDRTIQEYRVGGKLFMMRVTPKHGRAYVMIDHRGDGQLTRMDNLDSGVRVPQWVLLEF